MFGEDSSESPRMPSPWLIRSKSASSAARGTAAGVRVLPHPGLVADETHRSTNSSPGPNSREGLGSFRRLSPPKGKAERIQRVCDSVGCDAADSSREEHRRPPIGKSSSPLALHADEAVYDADEADGFFSLDMDFGFDALDLSSIQSSPGSGRQTDAPLSKTARSSSSSSPPNSDPGDGTSGIETLDTSMSSSLTSLSNSSTSLNGSHIQATASKAVPTPGAPSSWQPCQTRRDHGRGRDFAANISGDLDEGSSATSTSTQDPSSVIRPSSLVPELDHAGNLEYKLQIRPGTRERFDKLVTQMKWRLLQGGGLCTYEVGVLDDGALIGLPTAEMRESLTQLALMAAELGATVVVRRVVALTPASAPSEAWSRKPASGSELGHSPSPAKDDCDSLPTLSPPLLSSANPALRRFLDHLKRQQRPSVGGDDDVDGGGIAQSCRVGRPKKASSSKEDLPEALSLRMLDQGEATSILGAEVETPRPDHDGTDGAPSPTASGDEETWSFGGIDDFCSTEQDPGKSRSPRKEGPEDEDEDENEDEDEDENEDEDAGEVELVSIPPSYTIQLARERGGSEDGRDDAANYRSCGSAHGPAGGRGDRLIVEAVVRRQLTRTECYIDYGSVPR